MPESPTGLAVRVAQLERELNAQEDRLRHMEIADASRIAEVIALREDVAAVTTTINKLVWTIVGFTFTFAGIAVAFALSFGGGS